MAKLALLALAFVAIVAFSEDVGFSNTRGSKSSQEQCQGQIQLQELNFCQLHLMMSASFDDKLMMPVENQRQQDQLPHLQMCCSQLRNVQTQCQCEAIQELFDQARKQGGQLQMLQKLRKAQMLPKDCNLQVQDCPIASPRV
ncbi:PawS-like protein 1a [Artemisia annua]|uniref:PawS-like protein 1a n=1 Tax=Artemisia annua TaxID=35608 RepID=A0A2U1PDZ6_ARTAN|nr:PawS-like protein 1a [Artemisia annua]